MLCIYANILTKTKAGSKSVLYRVPQNWFLLRRPIQSEKCGDAQSCLACVSSCILKIFIMSKSLYRLLKYLEKGLFEYFPNLNATSVDFLLHVK